MVIPWADNSQAVEVDVWDFTLCPPQRTTKFRFSFGLSDTGTTRFFWRTRQLGLAGTCSRLYLPDWTLRGRIYVDLTIPRWIMSTLKTTPAEDRAWLMYMLTQRVGTPDRYTAMWWNCVHYTNLEYADAPLHLR